MLSGFQVLYLCKRRMANGESVDFRDLNRATPKDEYPMRVAETLINAAAGHKILSFMDGNASYNQIFMAPKDVNKTAFRVPRAVGVTP
jgi:hypothetical protein